MNIHLPVFWGSLGTRVGKTLFLFLFRGQNMSKLFTVPADNLTWPWKMPNFDRYTVYCIIYTWVIVRYVKLPVTLPEHPSVGFFVHPWSMWRHPLKIAMLYINDSENTNNGCGKNIIKEDKYHYKGHKYDIGKIHQKTINGRFIFQLWWWGSSPSKKKLWKSMMFCFAGKFSFVEYFPR